MVLYPGVCLHRPDLQLPGNGRHFKGGKPVILYVCGQSLNLILTLLAAYIMFFVVFPGVTESLMN
jgi:hypothetical protein